MAGRDEEYAIHAELWATPPNGHRTTYDGPVDSVEILH